MDVRYTLLFGLGFAVISHAAVAQPLPGEPISLFTRITPTGAPPPEDSLAVFNSTLDVTGVAGMPAIIDVRIPRVEGDVVAAIRLEHMERRLGFGERDPIACDNGDPKGCEIIPFPDYPPELFSYTWAGQGDGYDLRLTINGGYAVGVIVGPVGRFALSWQMTKELNVEYFHFDDTIGRFPPGEGQQTSAAPASSATILTPSEARNSIVARIEPQKLSGDAATSVTQIDMLVLFTESARAQAALPATGTACTNTSGIVAVIQQGINDINMAFMHSDIPARIGVTTINKLSGYTLVAGGYTSAYQNLYALKSSTNINTLRTEVGADVVAVFVDTQTNLGPCGVSYVERRVCNMQGSSSPPTPCIGTDAFSDWAYNLSAVQCNAMDVFPHEFGHILGADHDADNGPQTYWRSFDFSFAYFDPFARFQTLMSEVVAIPPPSAPRILYFSNPNVIYNGMITGTSTKNNALAITNLVPGAATFRLSVDSIFKDKFSPPVCPSIPF